MTTNAHKGIDRARVLQMKRDGMTKSGIADELGVKFPPLTTTFEEPRNSTWMQSSN